MGRTIDAGTQAGSVVGDRVMYLPTFTLFGRKIDISVTYDGWFKPYIMHRRFDEAFARYAGHDWFVIIHVGWWELQVVRLV